MSENREINESFSRGVEIETSEGFIVGEVGAGDRSVMHVSERRVSDLTEGELSMRLAKRIRSHQSFSLTSFSIHHWQSLIRSLVFVVECF